jgi:subtilisin-like proprotein convertase family protein
MAAVAVVTACGGSGGSSNAGADWHDVEIPFVDAGQQQLLEEILAELPDVSDPGGQGTAPAIRTLEWPADFPADIGAGLTDAVLVQGLQPQAAYFFDVTLPVSVDSDDATLFVMNLDAAAQAGGPVCYGDPDCTGTVTANQVSIQLVSARSGTATLDIQPSSTPALINEGSGENPLELDLTSGSVVYAGSIGGTQAAQNQLRIGESFYRLTELTIGDRYEIVLNDASDNDVALLFDETAQCDPAYSGSTRCILIAGSREISFSVTGEFVLFGASFNLDIGRFSDAARFEGSWHNPISLAMPDTSVLHHTGQSDRYSSYYRVSGLDPERRYRLLLSGNTTAARLKINSPITSLPVYAPECAVVDEEQTSGDQYCIIENASDTYFRIESNNNDSNYLISIEPSAQNEGSENAPHALLYSNSRLLHGGEVNAESVYALQGLAVGEQYLLQLNAAESFPKFTLASSDGNEIDCDNRGLSHCIFTADNTTLLLTVADNNTDIGERFNLSVLPTDPSDMRSPAPYAEDLSLAVGSLPHTGTVSDFYSNYTITGLNADQYYLAVVRQLSERFSFAAWPNTASGILCNINTTRWDTTGCLTQAGSDGQLRVRVGGDSGGQFELSVQDAMVLPSHHLSEDTPLIIADASAVGVTSTIEVIDDLPAGAIAVTLQIAHGHSRDLLIRLEAPDGRLVTLADHIPGSTFAQTTYTDLADTPNPSGNNYTVHALRRYRPTEPLHVLGDVSTAGSWKLHVADDTYSNRTDALGGTLLGWGLSFRQ